MNASAHAVPWALVRSVELAKNTPQPAVKWPKAAWVNRVGQYHKFLDGLQQPLDRGRLIDLCAAVENAESAVHAFLATMIWGAGIRDHRVPARIAKALEDPCAKEKLYSVWEVCRSEEPLTAYKHARQNKLEGIGPAYGTKFMSFSSLSRPTANDGSTCLILDSVICSWFHWEAALELDPGDWKVRPYAIYLDNARDWAATLQVPVQKIEEVIFRSRRADDCANPRKDWPEGTVTAHRSLQRAYWSLFRGEGLVSTSMRSIKKIADSIAAEQQQLLD